MFEDMETVLTTLEGSSANAKKAMAWISDFAVKTPYELSDVTEAYKNLVSSGIDPMNGSLLAIGDAAAASGKPLLQLVDAVGKAKSGQFEQLRTAIGGIYQTIGNKLTYTFLIKTNKKSLFMPMSIIWKRWKNWSMKFLTEKAIPEQWRDCPKHGRVWFQTCPTNGRAFLKWLWNRARLNG